MPKIFEVIKSPRVKIDLSNNSEDVYNKVYQNPESEKLKTIEDIEQVVRQQVLKHLSPQIGVFLFAKILEQQIEVAHLTSCFGELTITDK